MKELMAAPVVPNGWPWLSDWTVIHTGDEPLRGPRERYAFTSRDALTRWAATREDGWRWVLLSEVPNRIVLVLDEAWGWKYAEPVPEMRSAEDGRRVLGMLLRGPTTSAQGWLDTYEYFLRGALQNTNGNGTDILCGLLLLRGWHANYVALDPKNWEANGELTTEGELVARVPRETYYVTSPDGVIAEGDGNHLEWHETYVGPVMVVGCGRAYKPGQWSPKPGKTEPPLYLRLLASRSDATVVG